MEPGSSCHYDMGLALGKTPPAPTPTQRALTCSTEIAASLGATCSLISSIFSTNTLRSSVISMEATGVPRTRTAYFSSTPSLVSSTPQFSAVCPPNVSRMPSGRSFFITCEEGWWGIKVYSRQSVSYMSSPHTTKVFIATGFRYRYSGDILLHF